MKRSKHYSTIFLAAMLSPAMLQITECGNGPTGNTLLTSLELEAGGQNRIVGFVSARRIYEIWVPEGFDTVTVRAESFDPGSILALSHLAVTDPVGIGTGQIDVTVPSGSSTMLLIVTAPGGAIGTYRLNVTHDADPPTCNAGAPHSKTVTVGCAIGGFPADQWVIPFELSVDPEPIQGGQAFAADIGGTAMMSEFVLDLVQTVAFTGGTTQFELADLAATVQVRSGATGPDVTLLVDASALVPGPTRFCQLPYDQVCTVDSDCLVPPCRPPVNMVDIPVSTDCAPGGLCDGLGKATGPDSQCGRNGFCVAGPLPLPLLTQSATYVADPSGGEVLWGWADQGVPGLVLCPDANEPRCVGSGGTLPDGTYALPAGLPSDPAAPVGIRTNVDDGFLFAEQCAMGTQSVDGGGAPIPNVVEPTPDADLVACLVHPPACLVNSDCPSGYNCVNHTPVTCVSGGVLCEPVPGACETIYYPVCGCDGVTYSNYCWALVAGVRASALGPCECTVNTDCSPSEYCNAVTCDGPGNCTLIPSSCNGGGGNVLACDGLTYDSVCAAAAAGVRVGGELYPPSPF